MKNIELNAYAKTNYLSYGHLSLLRKLKPIFSGLIAKLISLPEDATAEQRLSLFEKCIKNVNQFANEIETVERE